MGAKQIVITTSIILLAFSARLCEQIKKVGHINMNMSYITTWKIDFLSKSYENIYIYTYVCSGDQFSQESVCVCFIVFSKNLDVDLM